jgi:Glycosyltransferase like family
MIAFGISIPDPDPYLEYAKPGIELVAEPDSLVLAFASVGTAGRSLNLLVDAAAAHDDLEALVLVHTFTQLDDPSFCAAVRRAFADPEVAVAGCAGASGVRSIAWWEGRPSVGDVILRYIDHGGGEQPAYPWLEPEPPPQVVDTIDGCVMVLSPWAVRNVRFDEALRFAHGYDLDYCLQVRAAGRTVTTIDTRVIIHRSLDLIEDWGAWLEAHVQLAAKWEGRPPWGGGAPLEAADERIRARRAEAQAEAARSVSYARRLAIDAHVAELQQTVDEAAGSLSWRATRPLREINHLRRAQQARRSRPPGWRPTP